MQQVESLPLVTRAVGRPSQARARGGFQTGKVILLSLVLLYLGGVLVGPMVALLAQTSRIGFGKVLAAVTTPAALGALSISLSLVVVAVLVNAVVGAAGAVVLVRHRFVGRAWLSALCDLPLAVSPVMIGLSFLLLLGRDGLLSPLLEAIGVKIVFSYPGLVIATLFTTLPYTIREVVYVLAEIGTSEEEAAATLGASPLQTFFRVTLPNIRVTLGYGLLMTAARTLGEFGAILVLGGSISGQTQTATTFIHDAVEERDLTSAYGMALILSAISIALLLLLKWAKSRTDVRSKRVKT